MGVCVWGGGQWVTVEGYIIPRGFPWLVSRSNLLDVVPRSQLLGKIGGGGKHFHHKYSW